MPGCRLRVFSQLSIGGADNGFERNRTYLDVLLVLSRKENIDMRQRSLRFASIHVLVVAATVSCTVPNPNKRWLDAPVDGPVVPVCTANHALRCDDTKLVSCNADGTAEVSESCPFGCNPVEKKCASKPGPVCTANQGLRCDGANLVRCNADGTGEAIQPCSLGCDAAGKRCYDMEPSNGLGSFLARAGSQPDIDLGNSATINTDNGDITVGGSPIGLRSETLVQSGAPTIRVLLVRSLTAKDVVVTGKNALAVVSTGHLKINGVFSASAKGFTPGAGAFNDGDCKGKGSIVQTGAGGGGGGGGFGSSGGSGGRATNPAAFSISHGGAGGMVTGNAWLVPLRGGCEGSGSEGGGGAIQFVSGTRITIAGVVAANGAKGRGGGSGGGILLEAPIVEVPGLIVANGGGGDGIGVQSGTGEDGRLDATPARGGAPLNNGVVWGAGGNGGAGNTSATDGEAATSDVIAGGGHGGGGFGRIRVNTAPGGHIGGGIYSPTATFGPVVRETRPGLQ